MDGSVEFHSIVKLHALGQLSGENRLGEWLEALRDHSHSELAEKQFRYLLLLLFPSLSSASSVWQSGMLDCYAEVARIITPGSLDLSGIQASNSG